MSNFLHSVEEQLKSNKDRISVMRELQDHVETKKEFFESIGYDEEASTEKANEAMGDGEIVGQRLNKMHRSRTMLSNIILSNIFFMFLVAVNLSLIFYPIPRGNDIFMITFLWSLIVLVINLCFTAIAIRQKDGKLSAFLTVFSFSPFLARKFALSYPLCNFVFSFFNNYTNKIYNFFCVVIMVCLSAIIIIPNAFNIYHCKQIKALDNTRRQNEISRFMRNACVIVAMGSIILSVPCYAMNDLICKKQAELRDSLFNFVLNTTYEFDYNAWDELAEYLENSKYDFEYNKYKVFQNESDEIFYFIEKYTYRESDWFITFTFDENEIANGYSVNVNHSVDNLSLKYLYLVNDSWWELRDKLGEPYKKTDNVAKLSAYEIRKVMNVYSFTGMRVEKEMDSTVYIYENLQPFFANQKTVRYNHFQFDCDNNGICYQYKWY